MPRSSPGSASPRRRSAAGWRSWRTCPGPRSASANCQEEPVYISPGDRFTLTTDDVAGTAQRVSVSLPALPRAVKAGDRLFLNDGLIQLDVERVAGNESAARCWSAANSARARASTCPGSTWGSAPSPTTTGNAWSLPSTHGVDAVSQSFVDRAEDIVAVRSGGRRPGLPAVCHRQNRALAGPGAHRRDHGRRRRHHGGAGRPGGGDPHRGNRPGPEAADAPGQSEGQTGDHRHSDAGVHDQQPPADPGRGHRRGQRHPGRHGLRDALGRIGHGQLPGGRRGHAGRDRGRYRAPPRRFLPGPRQPHHAGGGRRRRKS